MIELLAGAVIGVLVGARYGWPVQPSAIAGLAFLGPILYVISTGIWDVALCWWPWHDRGNRIQKGPGRLRRRTKRCRLCGNQDRIRWGSRKIWGRS